MAKVFTITEGLENLGALKSGGQGSVYKARRMGQIITAIKILPTPIYSESGEDKNFTSFQNEVEKFKKVNESPNPNVVSIIASGITSSGNLPYIEMEYIEGPDLAELLTPPHDRIFSIKEIIKVADHLSNALAHCHRADVKHGDIKSNNVKFNQRTGNYMLLDFGLSVMSDEQRRTSLRHAGAIEFMAPEQNAGEMLFESDIYSFGIILFELLAGTVPFQLLNKGEMARNAVMVAHMESHVPEPLPLRRQALPDTWSYEKQEREMQVPGWITNMINKCLEKNPGSRFKNGNDLQEAIHSGIITEETKKLLPLATVYIPTPPLDEQKWKSQVENLGQQLAEKEYLVADLKEELERKDTALYQFQYVENYQLSKQKGVSKRSFFVVLAFTFSLAGYTGYHIFIKPRADNQENEQVNRISVDEKFADNPDSLLLSKTRPVKKVRTKGKKPLLGIPISKEGNEPGISDTVEPAKPTITTPKPQTNDVKYRVTRTAFFHDLPNEASRRNAYLPLNSEIVTTVKEKDGFIYVIYINNQGKPTKGWLLKKNLTPIYDY
ncbi:MAG: serine/threonine protein kinase [Ferruginibacter sp.]|nr:serine/threonine protein kinase [Ferruginibacter sp.]